MTRILLIIIISTAAGFFIGKYLYRAYKDKRLYYSALLEFVNNLMNNLSFRQEKLADVVSDFSKKTNRVFALQLQNFYSYISEGGDFAVTCAAVKKDCAAVENFFKNIGTVDIFTQKEALKSYQSEFGEKLKKSESDEKNKGMMMLKVATLAGLAVGILLM